MKTPWVPAAAVLALLLAVAPLSAAAKDDGSSFTLRPDYMHKEIYDVYEGMHDANLFITADAVLHTGHLLFDYSLRAVEVDKLCGRADKLTLAMIAALSSETALDVDKGPDHDADVKALLAFFSVPAKILDPKYEIPADVKTPVEADLDYIDKHEGFALSKTLENMEDFSQYIVRGHYTRNEALQRYFKAMMWYGRRTFRVEETGPGSLPKPDPWDEAHLVAETRRLVLITWMLCTVKIDGKPAIDTWNDLYTPTVLFAGRTEDLNPMEVKALAEKVWPKWPQMDLTKEKVLEFAKQAAAFTHPKVDSSGAGRKGFCVMAQRFTPDSYITQCLVTEGLRKFGDGVPEHPLFYTGSRDPRPFTWGHNANMGGPRRMMPRGLDVLAVLGCPEALAVLKAEGDTEYEGYDKMLAFCQKDVGKLMDDHKAENLYYAWLYALQPMLKPIESDKVAACLRSNDWMHKQMATALASWAELRHDTILYVKQSYTPGAGSAPGMHERPKPVHFVEPQPEAYRRMAAMVAKMQKDLAAMDAMPAGLEKNYERFAAVCEKLAVVADKELAGKDLTPEDQQTLAGAVWELKSCTVLPDNLKKAVLSETDSSMAVAADVHTDTNASKVLEECVGTPFLLTVTMTVAGKPVIFSGATFSYYEFKHPMDKRLTDEAWQKMLEVEKDRPALPAWLPVKKI